MASRGEAATPADERARRPPWSGGPPTLVHLVGRAIITFAVTLVAIRVASAVLDGMTVSGNAWGAAIAIATVNAVVCPIAVRFAMPVFVYTAGIASMVLNAWIIQLVADHSSTVSVDGFGWALAAALIITAVSMVASWLLSADDDATFARAVVRRQLRGVDPHAAIDDDTPGVLFLEIDGCSHGVLRRALRAGYMPNLDRWVHSGTHDLHQWECDLSSQTGASQAGLLLGSNEGIVAFRWFERDRQAEVVTSRPKDAARIERMLSTGSGLLADGGSSRNNLLTGDAASSQLTLSTALAGGGAGRTWRSYFASSDNVARTAVSLVADVSREIASTLLMRRQATWPRLRKGWRYPLLRAVTTVVLPDVTIDTLVADMVRGAPVAYATFVGYDEVAHHDGVERPSALAQLRRLDHAFGRIERARRYAAREYELVVLSDHGQSQGATFLQRYGESLEDVVHRVIGDRAEIRARTAGTEPAAQVSGALVELLGRDDVELTGRGTDATHEERLEPGDVLVMASGNLGLLYLTGRAERATLEELEQSCPGLVDELSTHPGVGFVLVRTAGRGSVVIGADGRRWLDDGRVEGADPLAPYGPNALRHVRRHDGFRHVPDVLLVSTYDPELDEVAAFEELIGSHGGLGGEQSRPFVLAPAHLPWPDAPVIGAGSVHRVLRGWLHTIHQEHHPHEPERVR